MTLRFPLGWFEFRDVKNHYLCPIQEEATVAKN